MPQKWFFQNGYMKNVSLVCMKYGYPHFFFKIAFKAVKSLHCEMTLQ